MSTSERPLATLIGDVVASRTAASRAALHQRLLDLLEEVNATGPAVPLRITVGDEFQGCFEDLGSAVRAVRMLRLGGLPEVDLRFGIGWGPVTVLQAEPRVEDGPGWWAARAAIEHVADEAARAGTRRLRTSYRRADGVAGPDPAAVNAALLLRDEVIGGLSSRSLSVVRGLLGGRTQGEIAEAEQISASAVSQRVRKDGLAMLVAAEALLEEVR
ncbi:SatD family protein [Nocardioides jiangxiensis]|uniref:SatD family protein n=1 Tax=Nocardioides jiangxiensis TaxID=3064524 RepID=A0ABT9B1F5_9ACTN|nr:SatD family protein [Nocardioides sp. WY-20]MDO7867106.1 SatD family protein [Nocardioides sp. WY-20]